MSAENSRPSDEVDGQAQLAVAARSSARARGLDALRLAQRRADLVALGLEEREAHRAADQDRVGDLSRNASSTPILSVTFAPPTIATSGRRGSARMPGQRLDLALRAAGRRRVGEQVRDDASVEACARCAAPNASLT